MAAAIRLRDSFVPSSSVLRFLRSQVDEICFFTQNGHPERTAAHKPCRLFSRSRTHKSETPPVCTSKRLEASLLRLGSRRTHTESAVELETQNRWSRLGQCREASWARDWIKVGLAARKQHDSHRHDTDLTMANEQGTPILGRSKPADQLKLRCTEFDESGNVTLVSGEFKKKELIAMYGLLPRDLRKIDSSMLPHILVRSSAILINLLHLRVLIKHDRVLVFDVYGSTDSYSQSSFMYDLEHKLRENPRVPGTLPYELRALEAVLISVTSGLEQEFELVREPVVRVLGELEEDIDREKLRHLLIHSKRMGTFEQRARLVRDAIDNILEEDDDLSAMYLTETAQGKSREDDDHTEVEMLLESYHKVCDEIVQASSNLVSNIRNTEEVIKAILDANRNALMLLDLKFSIGTLGIGSGAFIAALYGMNLKNYMEEAAFGFVGMTGFSFAFALVVVGYGLVKLRRVQRVSMWGSGQVHRGKTSGGRASWREIDPMPALPGESGRQRWKRLHEAKLQARRQDEEDIYVFGLDGAVDRGKK